MGKKEKLEKKIIKLEELEKKYDALNETLKNKNIEMILNDIKETQPEFYQGFYNLFHNQDKFKKSALTKTETEIKK
jgi:uncharacterized protein YbaP (TraB family)